jgi:hypothetical protein
MIRIKFKCLSTGAKGVGELRSTKDLEAKYEVKILLLEDNATPAFKVGESPLLFEKCEIDVIPGQHVEFRKDRWGEVKTIEGTWNTRFDIRPDNRLYGMSVGEIDSIAYSSEESYVRTSDHFLWDERLFRCYDFDWSQLITHAIGVQGKKYEFTDREMVDVTRVKFHPDSGKKLMNASMSHRACPHCDNPTPHCPHGIHCRL